MSQTTLTQQLDKALDTLQDVADAAADADMDAQSEKIVESIEQLRAVDFHDGEAEDEDAERTL